MLTPEQAIKDPSVLEFLNLKDEYSASDLEEALIQHLADFLLELGDDFAFVGRQYRLRIDDILRAATDDDFKDKVVTSPQSYVNMSSPYTQLARVLRGISIPACTKIPLWRYSGNPSAYLETTTWANMAAVANALGMNRGGTGATLTP